MNARNKTIRIRSNFHPRLKLDSAAGAAYIQFNRGKVMRTVPIESDSAIVNADLNAKGEVVGIELIGVSEFSIKGLLEKTPFKTDRDFAEDLRFQLAAEGSRPSPFKAVS